MLKLSLIGSALIAHNARNSRDRYNGVGKAIPRQGILAGTSLLTGRRATLILVNTALVVFALHTLEIVIWAGAYELLITGQTNLQRLKSLSTSLS